MNVPPEVITGLINDRFSSWDAAPTRGGGLAGPQVGRAPNGRQTGGLGNLGAPMRTSASEYSPEGPIISKLLAARTSDDSQAALAAGDYLFVASTNARRHDNRQLVYNLSQVNVLLEKAAIEARRAELAADASVPAYKRAKVARNLNQTPPGHRALFVNDVRTFTNHFIPQGVLVSQLKTDQAGNIMIGYATTNRVTMPNLWGVARVGSVVGLKLVRVTDGEPISYDIAGRAYPVRDSVIGNPPSKLQILPVVGDDELGHPSATSQLRFIDDKRINLIEPSFDLATGGLVWPDEAEQRSVGSFRAPIPDQGLYIPVGRVVHVEGIPSTADIDAALRSSEYMKVLGSRATVDVILSQ